MLDQNFTMAPMLGSFRERSLALTAVPAETRQRFLEAPATREAHAELMSRVPAMRQVEVGNVPETGPSGGTLRVAAWNLERCLYPDAAAKLLRRHAVDLVLLSEMDAGMRRTGQRHTTRDLARLLGHGYGYALEFLELAAMPAPVVFEDDLPGNRMGFHGNAFTAALPFRDPVVIRLDEVADWYVAAKGGQKRVGTRMAVAATFRHGTQEFVGCSVHLESNSDFEGRAAQMRRLLDELDRYAGDLPVVIGGDLNTVVQAGGHGDAREMLFAESAARGYDWSRCNLAWPTTRRSTWSTGAGTRQLDWFCTRGLEVEAPEVIPSISEDGKVLTDHELILLTLRF
ncbi:endonuclease/exonuclease/phosphatase family protein [Roseomonas elaeocarpi]|uniref:Endonuclease/exonuclease/phosphatase family protein n=1 Tax=Roseomonas elaeocarpi TaxID=907779 RepID=A0ABV6JWJ1_9PROT